MFRILRSAAATQILAQLSAVTLSLLGLELSAPPKPFALKFVPVIVVGLHYVIMISLPISMCSALKNPFTAYLELQ